MPECLVYAVMLPRRSFIPAIPPMPARGVAPRVSLAPMRHFDFAFADAELSDGLIAH